MTRIDWIAVGVVALAALVGLRRGLVATALGLGGLAAGAVAGARVAPHFLHGGAHSPYTPLAALAGAIVGAVVLESVASAAGAMARGGLGVEGSGWVARPHLVVTAAHVVAGAHDILADGRAARAWAIDRRNDVAVLRVPTLAARPLPLADPSPGTPVAILGYPENGPFDARAGRLGSTQEVLLNGRLRAVTAFAGLVRHGNSGGPAVDARGAVRATVFAARIGSRAGYGVPAPAVRAALANARGPVSTGGC